VRDRGDGGVWGMGYGVWEGLYLFVSAAVAHDADGLDGQKHHEGLPDVLVHAGRRDLLRNDRNKWRLSVVRGGTVRGKEKALEISAGEAGGSLGGWQGGERRTQYLDHDVVRVPQDGQAVPRDLAQHADGQPGARERVPPHGLAGDAQGLPELAHLPGGSRAGEEAWLEEASRLKEAASWMRRRWRWRWRWRGRGMGDGWCNGVRMCEGDERQAGRDIGGGGGGRTAALNNTRSGSSSLSFMCAGRPPTLWCVLIVADGP
jgi:hypothetical protein